MRYEGVIFDMDGTLIEPLLDFAKIRRELGIDPSRGILEAIDDMPETEASLARERLLGWEIASARLARLLPGAAQAVRAVSRAGLKTALLTRNTLEAMRIVLERFAELRFDLTFSRESGPIKPQPDGIIRACARLGIDPRKTACVGDFHYDITAANAAGAVSVLLAAHERPGWADQANFVIESLDELSPLLGIS